jgi:hypothetical protein
VLAPKTSTDARQDAVQAVNKHVIGDELSSGHVLRGAPGDFTTTSLPLLCFSFLTFLSHVRATSSTPFDESCLVRLDQWEKLENVFYSTKRWRSVPITQAIHTSSWPPHHAAHQQTRAASRALSVPHHIISCALRHPKA